MPRELKSFTIQTSSSFPKQTVMRALGAERQSQADLYVLARTKKDAIARLSEHMGTRAAPASVYEGRGDVVEAIAEATSFYEGEGDMIATVGIAGNRNVAVLRGGQWHAVGETTHRDPGKPGKFLQKPIFVPVEQPPAQPVRITIELDADTPADVVRMLLERTVLRVTDGTGVLYAFGKAIS